ncbi:DUF4382 domain-containing protein [Dehalogenimonas sp. THU2]|uniref:DUF4382 domain-containing protein n=1 Tax=Dehalogenimonas sp. THU2 TaxID=3151121 RepID=UPI003218CA40
MKTDMNDNYKDIDLVLDACLDRMQRGESIGTCLAEHPEHAQALRPLLEAVARLDRSNSFTPSDEAKRRARQRLFAHIDKRKKAPFWARFPAWASVAGVLLLILVGVFSYNVIVPMVEEPPVIVVSNPPVAGQGNFVFLVSDQPNDIGDFTSLIVTVDRVELLKQGGGGDARIVFTPEIKDFDLTELIGEASQELWRGDVPEGEYTRVVVFTTTIRGTLTTGETIDIKLPSDKLQIDLPFTVGGGNVTSFTFDITVNKTGQGSGKYILKPQTGESGAEYEKVQ